MFYEFDHPMVPDYFFCTSGKNFAFPAHIHYCYELVIVETGEMTVTINDEDYVLGEGEAVMIFPNQIHSFRTEHQSRYRLYIFAPNLVSAYTNLVGERIPVNNKFRLSPLAFEMRKGIYKYSPLLEIKGYLYTMCSEFHKTAEYMDISTDSKSLLFRIFRFIQKNYGGSCTLGDLSQYTGYDYSYLSRYFKRIVGISFNDYVSKVRISHACYLISNTDMSVLEISDECGFKSLRSMNRNFKEQVGVPPSEYRKVRSSAGVVLTRNNISEKLN